MDVKHFKQITGQLYYLSQEVDAEVKAWQNEPYRKGETEAMIESKLASIVATYIQRGILRNEVYGEISRIFKVEINEWAGMRVLIDFDWLVRQFNWW